MKNFTKVLTTLIIVVLTIFVTVACTTTTMGVTPEEQIIAEAEAEPVEAPIAEEAVPVESEDVESSEPIDGTYRIVITNGLLDIAVATYTDGFGFDDVSAIVEYSKKGTPTIVIDAGANAENIPEIGLDVEDGAVLAAIVKAIGYDAMTPGVADLQFGIEHLDMLGEASEMSIVSANVAELTDSVIVEVDGLKVGIFGLTSPLANQMGVNVSPEMGDFMSTIEASIKELKAAGADFVIALTNMGFEQAGFSVADLNWAADFMSGYIDLFIDGMGSVPYQEVRGTTIYAQIGGASYASLFEFTISAGVIENIEVLLVNETMTAGLEPNANVQEILASEGKRLAEKMSH